ncbi:DUF4331 domain-containing protein [Angustibacter peucedani]
MAPPAPTRPLRRRGSALRASTIALTGSALAFGGSIALLGPGVSSASSHREAPLTAADPQADNTDTYAFVSPDKPDTVTLVANWIPFEDPSGGPNFYPWSDDAHYNIKIDSDGDAKPDVTYQWQFKTTDKRGTKTFLYNNGPVKKLTDPTLLLKQTYTLKKIDADGKETTIVSSGKVAPSNVGKASMPDYASLRRQSIAKVKGGGQSFAGQADDPFFLDLRVFDLLYGANLSESGNDTLSHYNVNSVALQIPKSELGVTKADPVIGVWSTTDRPSMRVAAADGTQKYSGDYVQVSRLGNPLVNELVVPTGLKDAFNALPPEKDRTVQPVVDRVLDPEVPKLVEKIYGIKAPKTPRNDLQAIFLTGLKGLNQPAKPTPSEMLRLNTSIKPTAQPNRLGVLAGDNAGFPNGRRLGDDVVDITLQAAEGAVTVDKNGAPKKVSIVQPLAAGDGVNANDVAFGSSFPYLALPNSGSAVGASSAKMPSGAMNTGATPDDGFPTQAASAGAFGLLLAGLGVLLFRRERRTAVVR